nr:hypothetical protein [Tanacetum cinerariifolium]
MLTVDSAYPVPYGKGFRPLLQKGQWLGFVLGSDGGSWGSSGSGGEGHKSREMVVQVMDWPTWHFKWDGGVGRRFFWASCWQGMGENVCCRLGEKR